MARETGTTNGRNGTASSASGAAATWENGAASPSEPIAVKELTETVRLTSTD